MFSAPFALLDVLWLAWLASWLVAAAWTAGAPTVARQSGLSRLAHGLFVWGGVVLLFFPPARPGTLVRPLFPSPPWVGWAGVVLAAGGLAFTWWARIHLGRLWSSAATLRRDHFLVRVGPYALTRHPIYTGLLLALTGTALARDSVAGLVGLALLLAGIVVKLRQEERLLLERFGTAYEVYRGAVPALIPWV